MKKGFTLIELIIVVIVMGILATVAVPQYLRATERAKGGKARHALGLIASAEKMFRSDSATDVYVACADKAACNTALNSFVELDQVAADADWNYAVTIGAGTFTATATRIGSGTNAGETISLTQAGTWAGNFTP